MNMQTLLYYCCIAVLLFAVVHGGGSKSEGKLKGIQAKNLFDGNSDIPAIQLSKDVDVDAIKRQLRRRYNRRRKNRMNSNRNIDENFSVQSDPKQILRDAIRHMFGFEHMVSASDTITGINSKPIEPAFDTPGTKRGSNQRHQSRKIRDFMPQPPDFMVELYRTYSQDKDLMLLHSRSIGNTVRSFFPTPADPLLQDRERGKPITISPISDNSVKTEPERPRKISQIPVFLFNLTAIPSPETLVGAEIRLDGFGKQMKFKYRSQTSENSTTSNPKNESSFPVEWKMIAAVYKLSTTNCNDELDCVGRNAKIFYRVGKSIILGSGASTAWTANDFTRIAKKARRPNHVIIVRFESENTEALSRQIRHTENEHTNIEIYDLPKSFTIADSERIKRNSEYRKSQSYREDNSPSERKDNWLDTNGDLPAIPILIVYCNDSRTTVSDETSVTAPIIWQALENVTSYISKRSRRSVSDDLSNSKERESRDSDGTTAIRKNRPQVVNKVKEGEKSKGKKNQDRPNRERKRKRNCKGKRKRRGECTSSKKIRPHPSLANKQADTKCGRKSLHVDFEDIEWSNWIIYPTTFDAYYCTGMCELSQMLKKGATNHAVVQALLRAEGRLDVPAPCCVPDKLMSLAVLFFDAQKNVVMKEYPTMSVETCMCR